MKSVPFRLVFLPLLLIPTIVDAETLSELVTGQAPARSEVDARVAVNFHITVPTYGGCDALDDGDVLLCEDLESTATGDIAFGWIVVTRTGGFPRGIAAVGLGMAHNLGAVLWTNCTGGGFIQHGPWPRTGTGISAFYSGLCNEPPGENVKIGFLTLPAGTEGFADIRANPGYSPAEVQWLTCDDLDNSISVPSMSWDRMNPRKGTSPICPENPSSRLARQPEERTTSWGRVKSLY